jgi:hypothetical protein
MYREQKEDESITLQVVGKEKPSKKSKVTLVKEQPPPVENKPVHGAPKGKLSFVTTKQRRQYFPHQSRKLSNKGGINLLSSGIQPGFENDFGSFSGFGFYLQIGIDQIGSLAHAH